MVGEMSGTRNGRPWPPRGETIDLPDEEARTLIGNKMAVPELDPQAGVERAVADTADVEQRAGEGPLTTATGPTRRRAGRQGE